MSSGFPTLGGLSDELSDRQRREMEQCRVDLFMGAIEGAAIGATTATIAFFILRKPFNLQLGHGIAMGGFATSAGMWPPKMILTLSHSSVCQKASFVKARERFSKCSLFTNPELFQQKR